MEKAENESGATADRMNKTVLFLCTGNYYRSRFAEMFFNWHAEHQIVRWRAQSRGFELFPDNVGPMSTHTIARLGSHGIPIAPDQRLPLVVSGQDFEAANHIVAVKETEHRPMLERIFPTFLNRVEFWNIDDLDCAGPSDAIPLLESKVMTLIGRWHSKKA